MKKTKGFTLIELLVVISIISLLSTVVLSSLSTARIKARDAQRQITVKQIQSALELYYHDFGTYPLSGAGGGATGCISPAGWSTSIHASCWTGANSLGARLAAYLPNFPVDPVNSATSGSNPGTGLGIWYFSSGTGGAGTWYCTGGKFYVLVYRRESATNAVTTTGCPGSTLNNINYGASTVSVGNIPSL